MAGYLQVDPSAFEFPFVAEMAKRESLKAEISGMIPCVVTSRDYDRTTHRVKVLPLVTTSDSNGYHTWPEIVCTVWRPFFGNYLIDFPVKEGDTGWVVAADRETDIVKQNCRPNAPAPKNRCDPQVCRSKYTHDFSWGIFIPDRWGKTGDRNVGDSLSEDDVSEGRFVLQSADSRQRLSIGHDDIKIVSVNKTDGSKSTVVHITDGTVKVETKTLVEVKCPTVEFKGIGDGKTDFTIDGTLHVTGDADLDGTVTTEADFVSPVAKFNTHTHKEKGVQGNPDTDAPTQIP